MQEENIYNHLNGQNKVFYKAQFSFRILGHLERKELFLKFKKKKKGKGKAEFSNWPGKAMEPGRHFTDPLNEAESQELFLARWGAESTRCGRTIKGPTISLREERKSS